MNQRANVLRAHGERAGIDVENAVLAVVPDAFTLERIPVPRAHLAGGERERAAPLAREQPGVGRRELGGPFGDALLQLPVELLQLAGLPVELREHPDLGAQHIGDDRNRNVVDRSHRVAAQPVHVSQVNGGDEDDRRLLEARVVADHRGKLETVEIRHADVHQHDGDLALEQLLERLARRARLDQVLAELLEHHLVAQELGRLVVDQQDVDCILHHVPRA